MSPAVAVEVLLQQLPLWAVTGAMALLGAIWGSFGAALCSRWPNGEGIVTGRSRCDHCGVSLSATELIPIFSYLRQSGKCRSCGGAIARSTIQIELACAILGAASVLLLPGISAIAGAVLCWLLVPLAILDWRHLWLPDRLIVAFAITGLLLGDLLSAVGLIDRLIGGAAGFFTLELLRLGFARLRGVEGMGKGDPKLLGAIGLWLGWPSLPVVLLLASAIGLGHYLLAARTRSAGNMQLPLGSYLAAAAVIISPAAPYVGP